MHGPPPTPEEIRARLWRYVRRQPDPGWSYRESVLRAAEDLGIEPNAAFAALDGTDA